MASPSIAERPSCTCAESTEQLPIIDARLLPPAVRHPAILGAVDSLTPGRSLAIVAPHEPKPLLAQIREAHGASLEITYLESGPAAWIVQLSRV